MSWRELNGSVARMQRALVAAGITAGDRVCAVVPNMPETIVAFLACASLGAIWSSCSPDFGERGILDRFGQIAPRLLITCDGYYYAGKTIGMGAKIANVLKQLPSVERTCVIIYLDTGEAGGNCPVPCHSTIFSRPTAMRPSPSRSCPSIIRSIFSIPPAPPAFPNASCIAPAAYLLKHLCEHVLNTDVKPDDRLFYFTTCGWMMWNWLVSRPRRRRNTSPL